MKKYRKFLILVEKARIEIDKRTSTLQGAISVQRKAFKMTGERMMVNDAVSYLAKRAVLKQITL